MTNSIQRYNLISQDPDYVETNFATQVRFQVGLTPGNLDLGNGNHHMPNGVYNIKELGVNIRIIRNDENRYQFFTI
jgi:hypothetical protein